MTGPHPLWRGREPLVLASKSAIRLQILRAAGLPVDVVPAVLDERSVEHEARARGADAAGVATALAREKARAVSRAHPGRVVLGADQTLDLGSDALHKPADLDAARAQLRRMSGRRHTLHSAAAIARSGEVLAVAASMATLTMRPLSDDMIERYCRQAGAAILDSVGAYQLEGPGIHLFETIEGDHFTILGLPLLEILAALRDLDHVAR
jgi:septum formation protein